MIDIDNLTTEELLVLTNALALSLSKGRTPNQITSLGTLLNGVAALMFVISSQQSNQESNLNNTTENNNSTTSQTTGHAGEGHE